MWRDISAVEAQCDELFERLEKIEKRPATAFVRDPLWLRMARGLVSFIGHIVFLWVAAWTVSHCIVWISKTLDPRREAAAVYHLSDTEI